MSVSACLVPTALFQEESTLTDTMSAPANITTINKDEEHADQSSIWTVIQTHKSSTPIAAAPYVHPLMRRSSSLMSKSSLDMCTESLGSENGSGYFSDDDRVWLNSLSDDDEVAVKQKTRQQQLGVGEHGNQLMSVNYHCSVSRRSPAPRSFPPPLPSISRQDGNRIQMRTRHQDGRHVVHAVPVASQIFLHARRQDGRLLLSLIGTTAATQPRTDKATQEPPLKVEDQMVGHIQSSSKEINQSQGEAGDEE